MLDRLLQRQGLAGRLRQAQAVIVWPEVAGAEIARHTRALEVRDGTLRVAVRSSAWAAQLSFLRTDLLAALNRRIGQPGLRGLRFSVDPVQGAARERGQRVDGGPSRPCGPSPAAAAAIDAAVAQVSDPETRRAWRRALIASVARRHRLGE